MTTKKPNIIYIYADDLGRGMLSCYGQKHFTTPHIDSIATQGMRFDRVYANPFCAPARASFLCGIHDAHAGRWSYSPGGIYKKLSTGELTQKECQEVIQKTGIQQQGVTLPALLKQAGYVTGEIGKLEWGFATTPQELQDHGWDYHYGYYDHIRCHGFYPPFLFEQGEKVEIAGNTDPHCGRPAYGEPYPKNNNGADMSYRQVYSQDLFDEKIIEFLHAHQNEPFFLYHPSQLPHGPVFYPDHHPQVANNTNLTDLEKEYASMVLRLDHTVGRILSELETLGLREKTLVVFASDNGHENSYYATLGRTQRRKSLDGITLNDKDTPFRTSTCGDTFNGNDGLAGLKFSNWDGGNRIIWLAQWPEHISAGTRSDQLISNYDSLATFCTLAGVEPPTETDGISFVPTLLGTDYNSGIGETKTSDIKEHDYVVFSSNSGPAVVTKDGWKLRFFIPNQVFCQCMGNPAKLPFHANTHRQLFQVLQDPAETTNLASQYPKKVEELTAILIQECDGNLRNGTARTHLAGYAIELPTWAGIVKGEI